MWPPYGVAHPKKMVPVLCEAACCVTAARRSAIVTQCSILDNTHATIRCSKAGPTPCTSLWLIHA